ncbi:unnamed protein product [Aphanomyces euteiches]|nr:hypothetical protein AeMF1_020845 [Aphanomyces euteiches]KAH9107378.1 hypothetical protein LEN26_014302 [Aphanomyces euteiches]KAH9138562.1 hypothetical protein AeRB84_017137 [Aphanomyces euteiches]KAH9193919.1 hypothetical protein AeNC1_004097 [Aphanomyces euteiches]
MDEYLEIHLLANRTVIDDIGDKKVKYTNYIIYIKNLSTGNKYSVQRRYSDFYEFRHQLLAILNGGHCAFCTQCYAHVKAYPFPRRTPLSWQLSVVQERIDGLTLFIKDILRDLLGGTFRQCMHADTNLRHKVLRSFLEVEEQQLQKKVLVAISHETKPERTRSFPHLLDQQHRTPDVTPRRKVAADTCPSCLSKWTDCYCNDDEMFPERIDLSHDGWPPHV